MVGHIFAPRHFWLQKRFVLFLKQCDILTHKEEWNFAIHNNVDLEGITQSDKSDRES